MVLNYITFVDSEYHPNELSLNLISLQVPRLQNVWSLRKSEVHKAYDLIHYESDYQSILLNPFYF